MSDTILFQQDGPIGTMTFNRPAVYNAMNTELILALRDTTNALMKNTTLRVLIVKGAGKAFLAGGDVAQFHARLEHAAADVLPMGDALHDSIVNIRTMPFPVIAQIHGAVAGAGFSLALACDFAIAADDAHFTSAYSRIGVSPDGGSTFFLPRIVGMKKALELVMLSDTLNAQTAAEIGLINRVVAAAELDGEVMALATRLAAGPTQAYAAAKLLINQSYSTPIRQHLDDEIARFAECTRTADFREGVTAFVDKRKATFIGK